MTKSVLFGDESRQKMLIGVRAIADAVRVTMGASGKCVLVGNAIYGNDGLVHLPTIVSKDGWTVTKHFELPDAVEHRGAMLIKEAANKTVEQAGDSTTATCVLAEAIISGGIEHIKSGSNSQQIKKGLDYGLDYVVGELKKISTPVLGNIDRIRQIATVSANNDSSIGNLIAEAYEKIGDAGVIDIEQSKGTETEIKVSDGYKFDRGWLSPLFVNVKDKETCEFDEPYILLYQHRITHHTQIQTAIEYTIKDNKPLLIICEDIDEQGLGFLGINNYQGRIRVCAVKSPEFGDARREWMEDIAVSTGATYISDLRGIGIKEVTPLHFGKAKKVIVSKTETTIIGGGADKQLLEDTVNDLKMNLAQAKTEEEKFPIEKRIARLTGSAAVIYVGAATETELHEKMDRVDDAVRATKAAIAEGFVAGGGTAFVRIPYPNVQYPELELGVSILFDALKSPLKQICKNSGVSELEISEQVINETGDNGYNVLTGNIENMVESGIIDSTKALRCALVNAVSVAGMFLTSECSIVTTH